MGYLSKEALLSVEEGELFDVSVPSTKSHPEGGTVQCKSLKANEQAQMLEMSMKSENGILQTALWPLFALWDGEKNCRMFDSGELDLLLQAFSLPVLVNISNQIGAHLTGNEVKKEIKNSDTESADIIVDSSIASV